MFRVVVCVHCVALGRTRHRQHVPAAAQADRLLFGVPANGANAFNSFSMGLKSELMPPPMPRLPAAPAAFTSQRNHSATGPSPVLGDAVVAAQ